MEKENKNVNFPILQLKPDAERPILKQMNNLLALIYLKDNEP